MSVRATVSICCSPPERLPPRRRASSPSVGKNRYTRAAGQRRRPASPTQVLLHREVAEDAPVLGHPAHAQPADLVGGEPRDVTAVETHAAAVTSTRPTMAFSVVDFPRRSGRGATPLRRGPRLEADAVEHAREPVGGVKPQLSSSTYFFSE